MPSQNRKRDSENLARTGYYDHRLDLYRQAAQDLRTRDSGIARYVIEIFGPDLIGSWAFALDPYKQFRNTANRVALLSEGSPVVRTTTRMSITPKERKLVWRSYSIIHGYAVNPQAGNLFTYYYTGPRRSGELSGVSNRPGQPAVYGTRRDTTRRTRTKGKDQGEFEIFDPYLRSPNRSFTWHKVDRLTTNTIGTGQRTKTDTYDQTISTGPEFYISNANVQTFLPVIRARALAAMQKNVLGMLDNVQPSHRNFDLVRQIAELKDLPQTIRGTLEIWLTFERFVGTRMFRDLQNSVQGWRNPDLLAYYARHFGRSNGFSLDPLKTIDQSAAAAFLTFKFGWEATVRGVLDFLPSPHRTARQINYLLSRIGMDTSFRTKRTWTEEETSHPNVTFNYLRGEDAVGTDSSNGSRHVEIRLVANFNINFPHADIPRLRRELFLRKLGAYPSATDLYNLIPWTWLGDWFTGAGDYLSLVETITKDTSLINYGFITYREVSNINLCAKGRFSTTVQRDINGVSTSYERSYFMEHTAKLGWTYQLRRSVPSLANVRTYWDSDLNGNQAAILGALLATKGGSRARRVAS